MYMESKTLELKREYTEEIKKTIIAFANTDGGKLMIGIEDDGSVVGVTDSDAVMLQIANAIRDTIRPDVTLFTEIRQETLKGKTIIVVETQRGTSRPYYLGSKGLRPAGVYIRQGPATVPATETAILNMIKETSGDRYENARSLNQQLTFERADKFFAKRGVPFGKEQKKTLGLTDADGTYTNLALLLSDQCPHTIKSAVFEGGEKAVFRDRQEFSGSLLAQLEEAYAFIDRFNSLRAEFQGLDRIDIRDYPPETIREALLNAIAHRDYAFSASTLISIFTDRIEFVSIGGLPKGITYEDILLGVSVPRNPRLANIFYRLRLIEAFGTGIPKIKGSYQGQAAQPLIQTSDNAFKITLPNINCRPAGGVSQAIQADGTGLSQREEQVLRLLDETGSIVRKDVERALGISQATAIILLRQMIEKGLLRKVGGGKKLRYQAGR